MILQELKDWVNGLPEEFMEFSMVNGEVGVLNEEFFYRLDKPITTFTVDEKNKEVCFLNDSVNELTEEELKNDEEIKNDE